MSDLLRDNRALVTRLCPDVGAPSSGGMRDLMLALTLADAVGDELPELNKVLRRTDSLQIAADQSRDPAAALAYLLAADRVIQVDDFG